MKKELVQTSINVNNTAVRVMRVRGIDYISLTDLAKYKNSNNPGDVIIKWMSNKSSFDFYCLWEELSNENFKLAESREFKTEAANQSFTMSPSQWIKMTNSIGFITKRGKYDSGTFAHPDIALEFASWLDPAFKLYLIKEFERLKTNEAYQNKIQWSVKRDLSKTNYAIHTDAIKENLVPLLTDEQKKFIYASEADVLNVALFGMTAKEWREANPDLEGNMRDYANILQLVVLINLENLNAEMINSGIEQTIRLEKLNNIAQKQMKILKDSNGIKKIEKIDKNELLLE